MDRDGTRLREWIRDNRLAAAVIATTIGLLAVQRLLGWNWDFGVYMMNGEYLLHGGSYIEWYRAPVAGLVMGMLRFVAPRPVAAILFVTLTALLFFYAAHRIAQRYDLDEGRFVLLLASPYIIMQGTFHGTEMLALAFGMLFVAEMDRPRSGLWLAAAFLTRYTFIFAVPLVLLQRDVRNMITTYAVAAVPVLGWFGFNWIRLGDPFTSIANAVALNVGLREIWQAPDPTHFVLMTGVSSAFIALYLVRNGVPDLDRLKKRQWLVLAGFTVMITFSYLRTPVKPLRYLYPLAFPAAVAAGLAWQRLDLHKYVLPAILLIHLAGAAVLVAGTPAADPSFFTNAADDMEDCRISSNIWTHLSYAGAPAEPMPDIEAVRDQVKEGYRVVVFPRNPNPAFTQNETAMDSLPTITETEDYIILGMEDQCADPVRVDRTYFSYREERLAAKGIEEDREPCRFLFGDICRFAGL